MDYSPSKVRLHPRTSNIAHSGKLTSDINQTILIKISRLVLVVHSMRNNQAVDAIHEREISAAIYDR